jgi:hypothetical protein
MVDRKGYKIALQIIKYSFDVGMGVAMASKES